MTLVGTL